MQRSMKKAQAGTSVTRGRRRRFPKDVLDVQRLCSEVKSWAKTMLNENAEAERRVLWRSDRHISRPMASSRRPAYDALDETLEASFPASDPPAIPWTRIGRPRRPR